MERSCLPATARCLCRSQQQIILQVALESHTRQADLMRDLLVYTICDRPSDDLRKQEKQCRSGGKLFSRIKWRIMLFDLNLIIHGTDCANCAHHAISTDSQMFIFVVLYHYLTQFPSQKSNQSKQTDTVLTVGFEWGSSQHVCNLLRSAQEEIDWMRKICECALPY